MISEKTYAKNASEVCSGFFSLSTSISPLRRRIYSSQSLRAPTCSLISNVLLDTSRLNRLPSFLFSFSRLSASFDSMPSSLLRSAPSALRAAPHAFVLQKLAARRVALLVLALQPTAVLQNGLKELLHVAAPRRNPARFLFAPPLALQRTETVLPAGTTDDHAPRGCRRVHAPRPPPLHSRGNHAGLGGLRRPRRNMRHRGSFARGGVVADRLEPKTAGNSVRFLVAGEAGDAPRGTGRR